MSFFKLGDRMKCMEDQTLEDEAGYQEDEVMISEKLYTILWTFVYNV